MKVASREEWEKENNHLHSKIDQANGKMKEIDDRWEDLSEKEKYSEKGMGLLQEKGECMRDISKSRQELDELEVSK